MGLLKFYLSRSAGESTSSFSFLVRERSADLGLSQSPTTLSRSGAGEASRRAAWASLSRRICALSNSTPCSEVPKKVRRRV